MKRWAELSNTGKKRRLNKILETYPDYNRVNIVYSVCTDFLEDARCLILAKNNNENENITNLLK